MWLGGAGWAHPWEPKGCTPGQTSAAATSWDRAQPWGGLAGKLPETWQKPAGTWENPGVKEAALLRGQCPSTSGVCRVASTGAHPDPEHEGREDGEGASCSPPALGVAGSAAGCPPTTGTERCKH